MEKTYYSFDGHLHIPLERTPELLDHAFERNMDIISLTDYGNTNTFDQIKEKGLGKDYDISTISPSLLRIINEKGTLLILKGEEIKTKQGDLIAWGIKNPINQGLDISDTIDEIYKQQGLVLFPHLLITMFHGCGKEIYRQMHQKYKDQPHALELNGQFPDILNLFYKINERTKSLATEDEIVCFGNSDIHGRYRQESSKIGQLCFSRIPLEYPENLSEELREIMLKNQKIEIKGEFNTLTDVILWNLTSIRMNGLPKVFDLIDGIRH